MEKYLDTKLSPDERAEDLLGRMSLEEKMAQIVGYNTALWASEKLEEDYPDGAGGVSGSEMLMCHSPEEMAQFQRTMQKRLMALSKHQIPALFHFEGLCGLMVMSAASLPTGIGRAATWDPETEEKAGEIVGRQAGAVGIHQILAPVLDISRDPRFGRQGESYGEDPVLAAAMGTAYTNGVQKKQENGRKVDAVAKHFLGYQAGQGGIHAANADIPERILREIYAKPFQAAISKAGLKGIMPCYSSINGEPVTGSENILTGLLREEMGFEGTVVSDYGAVSEIFERHKVTESLAEAGRMALAAGMDMELPAKKSYNDELKERFASGKQGIEILNRAVKNILKEKFRLGLFENPYALDKEELNEAFYHAEDEKVVKKLARESLVLLKNDGILPIQKENRGKIAVIGPHADNIRSLFGGYTYLSMVEVWMGGQNTMAGWEDEDKNDNKSAGRYPGSQIQKGNPACEENVRQRYPKCRTLLEALQEKISGYELTYTKGYPVAGNDCSGYEEALKNAKDADLVLVTLGGKYGTGTIATTGEGVDAAGINLPVCQEQFLEKLEELGKKVIGVHFDGRPLSSDAADRVCGALIEAWAPAEAGAEAIADVLVGEYNPSGKLPVTVARHAGQIPVYYNHLNGSSYDLGTKGGFKGYQDCPHEPRYYFGHGLSYTEFSYQDMKLLQKKVEPDGTVTVLVRVKNTGTRAGEEVVQLYVKDKNASMVRPAMELEGFQRIALEAGEEKCVKFELSVDQLAFLNRKNQWIVEQGEIEIMAGSSSDDIRLRDTFQIVKNAVIDGRQRQFWAKAGVCR